jgi:pSer/pThr/pTyr-binding forkhead associated (FHA) protein
LNTTTISGDSVKVALKIKCKGSFTEHEIGLNGAVALGRSSKAEIQLDDEKISGSHCRFNLKRDRLELTDIDSKNGTYLNGIRIEQSEVFIGDEIRIGDTIISLEETHMTPDSVDALTFPGPFKDRLNYELKADFTGARIQNQTSNTSASVNRISTEASRIREIDLRKKVKSKVRVSKQEIRSRHKVSSVVSSLIDTFIAFTALCLPILIISKNLPTSFDKNAKLIVLLGLDVVAISGYYFFNFRFLKFTIGEKITGIEKHYMEQ